jgi:hypothetical protein
MMSQPSSDDLDYIEHVIKEVRRYDDGRYEIRYGLGFVYEATDGVAPQVGEVVRIYNGVAPGSVRGLIVGGRVYNYQTRAEAEVEHAAWREECDAEARKRFPEYDRRYAALPEAFRRRLDHFRRLPRFRLTLEGIELGACESAVRLAEECGSAEAVAEFQKLSYDLQRLARPWLVAHREPAEALDVICQLAFWWHQAPGRLSEVPGAMEYLVSEVMAARASRGSSSATLKRS